MNAVSLSDKVNGFRELNNANNAHLIGIYETWVSLQFTDQELVIPDMFLFRNDKITGTGAE